MIAASFPPVLAERSSQVFLFLVFVTLASGCGANAGSAVEAESHAPPEIPTRMTWTQRRASELKTLATRLESMSERDLNNEIIDAVMRNEEHILSPIVEKSGTVERSNATTMSPLIIACYHGMPESAKVLLSLKADPNATWKAGQAELTPMAVAISVSSFRVALLLLDHGADLDAGPKPLTPRIFLKEAGIASLDATRSQIHEALSSRVVDPDDLLKGGPVTLTAEQQSVLREMAEMYDRWDREAEQRQAMAKNTDARIEAFNVLKRLGSTVDALGEIEGLDHIYYELLLGEAIQWAK